VVSDWNGFGFDEDPDPYKAGLSDVPTEELRAELERRGALATAGAPATITGSSTVDEARAFCRRRAFEEKGGPCPVCKRRDVVDRRPLNKGQAAFLSWLVSASEPGEWVDTTTRPPKVFTTKVRDFTVLRHWNLIEPHVNSDTRKSGSGLWRATDKGRRWVAGELAVPSHISRYQDEPVILDDTKMVRVTDVLPDFDLAALLRGDA
jgi:hypothetical protein